MSKLSDLIELAQEPSSEKRRVLLRELTDLFFANPEHRAGEMALFDDVLTQLAGEMEAAVRAELAERIAPAADAPVKLVHGLAADEAIEVARPILEASRIAHRRRPARRRARPRPGAPEGHLAARDRVGVVSEVIVERADDETLSVLIRNDGATLSRQAHEAVVDRAGVNPNLHAAVVNRRSLPMDLLNEMYFVVEAQLRTKILERNAEIDPAELDAALAAGRNRLAADDGALPPDYDGGRARRALAGGAQGADAEGAGQHAAQPRDPPASWWRWPSWPASTSTPRG